MVSALPVTRDIELTESDFRKISAFIYEQCGIHLHDGKRELVKARLGKRIREGQFQSFRHYFQHVVEDHTGQELLHLLDSISTNFTSFFREPQHFEYLTHQFLPEIAKRKRNRQVSFWSAGCASGEEVYSIAITLLEALEDPSSWRMKILGTDISTRVLKMARAGIYAMDQVQTIAQPLLRKYFLRGEKRWNGFVKIKDEVKKFISFSRLNFMEPFSFSELFDCIFFRNVMIYFDKKTQAALVNRVFEQLNKGGMLMIGHSESLSGIGHPFTYVQPAIYKKE